MVGNLPRRVVSLTVAENAVLVVDVVANGDVHRAAQSGLRINVSATGHLTELFQRVGVGLSALGHASALRYKDCLVRNSNRSVLVRVCGLLLIIPKGVLAVASFREAISSGLLINRDRCAFLHQGCIDLDSRLAFDGCRSVKLRVIDVQVSLFVRALIINEDRLADAIEGAAVERNILRAVSPDVVSVRTRLIERAGIKRLAVAIQEHHTIEGAAFIGQIAGMLQASIVLVRHVIKNDVLEGNIRRTQIDLACVVKRYLSIRLSGNRDGLSGQIAQITHLVDACVDDDTVIIVGSLECLLERRIRIRANRSHASRRRCARRNRTVFTNLCIRCKVAFKRFSFSSR